MEKIPLFRRYASVASSVARVLDLVMIIGAGIGTYDLRFGGFQLEQSQK